MENIEMVDSITLGNRCLFLETHDAIVGVVFDSNKSGAESRSVLFLVGIRNDLVLVCKLALNVAVVRLDWLFLQFVHRLGSWHVFGEIDILSSAVGCKSITTFVARCPHHFVVALVPIVDERWFEPICSSPKRMC
jgi:hypothetical protein